MNTITLDSSIYNSVAAYARLHNMSVSEAVKTGMKVFLEIIGKNNVKDFEVTNGDVISPDEACLKLQNFEKYDF